MKRGVLTIKPYSAMQCAHAQIITVYGTRYTVHTVIYM